MQRKIELPPEICPTVLRRRYADLAQLDDDAVTAHYEQYGKAEGRVASDAAVRPEFIKMIPPDSYLLEIGPYVMPVFEGPNVRYLDMFDADTLRSRALSSGLDVSRAPGQIHYTGTLDDCTAEEFDVIFSSHAIEHQPDLVRHLQAVGAALKPDGSYWVIIPDKRFCFDHHLPESTLADVLDAYLEQRTRHSARSVINHIARQDHNDPLAHWQGRHGDVTSDETARTRLAIQHFEVHREIYIDCHAWQLTPDRFKVIHKTLSELGLSPFNDIRVYDTPFGNFEFTAVLRK
jgi:SAM-dependent methyltransferase